MLNFKVSWTALTIFWSICFWVVFHRHELISLRLSCFMDLMDTQGWLHIFLRRVLLCRYLTRLILLHCVSLHFIEVQRFYRVQTSVQSWLLLDHGLVLILFALYALNRHRWYREGAFELRWVPTDYKLLEIKCVLLELWCLSGLVLLPLIWLSTQMGHLI